jgi:uncharacterized protein YwqG
MAQKIYTMRRQVRGVLILSLVTLILGIICVIIYFAIPEGDAKGAMFLLGTALPFTSLITFIVGCKMYFENRESIKKEGSLSDLNAEADAKKLRLKELLSPLIRKSTVFVVKAAKNAEDSNLKSQFGGIPYFEKGERWPVNKDGKPLEFVFQIFNDGTLQMPENIKLVQFFFDFKVCPWENGADGYCIKVYEKLDKGGVEVLADPCAEKEVKYCEIAFKEGKSLPDWNEIGECSREAEGVASEADGLFDGLEYRLQRDIYSEVFEELTNYDDYDYSSHSGGFASWIQGSENPNRTTGEKWELLCQIDSEEDANIMWGDCGSIYIFYNLKTKELIYRFQCS